MPSAESPGAVVCLDVGSTYTKGLLVDLDDARVRAAAEHRTTVGTDVLEGVAACRDALAAIDVRARDAEVLACSSAGGGLRIAVVGNEALVTAEAGRRVALSSGGKVVAVVAAAQGDLDAAVAAGAVPGEPDVVLLTGGTDGGNAEVLLDAARGLVAAGWEGPVVVAGNAEAGAEAAAILAGRPVEVAANVVPRIGVLEPAGARAAIREVFLRHVIGGKGLSRGPAFARLVRGATPDVVLTGVEVLADALATAERPGRVVVVDVGGATTDVHSVVDLEAERRGSGLAREVVAPTRVTRTVEGDLGMRWSAETTAQAGERPDLADAARRRREDPGFLPSTDADHAEEVALARIAVDVAVRRHAGRARVVVGPDGRVVERTGRDLREVRLVVGSGGVLRHAGPQAVAAVLDGLVDPRAPGGWQLPEHADVVVDEVSVLAAVGLLAEAHPDVARRLAAGLARRTVAGG